jgi:hypothetical protein
MEAVARPQFPVVFGDQTQGGEMTSRYFAPNCSCQVWWFEKLALGASLCLGLVVPPQITSGQDQSWSKSQQNTASKAQEAPPTPRERQLEREVRDLEKLRGVP